MDGMDQMDQVDEMDGMGGESRGMAMVFGGGFRFSLFSWFVP